MSEGRTSASPETMVNPTGGPVVVVLQTTGGVSASGATGGGVLHFVELSKYWTRRGYRVYYVLNEYDKTIDLYKGVGTVRSIPTLGILDFSKPHTYLLELTCNHFVQRSALEAIMKEAQSASRQVVILATSPFPSDALAALLCKRLSNSCTILYFHHLTPPPWWFATRRGSILRTTISYLLMVFGLAVAKIGSLDIGLDNPSTLNSTGWKLHTNVLRDDDFLIEAVKGDYPTTASRSLDACFIGRIAESKGITDLILSWKKVVALYPRASLVICGQAVSLLFRRKLDKLVHYLRLEKNVSFKGYISNTEKHRLLADAKLFVLPSYEEGWSLAVMEAASFGAVPITYDLPAYDYLGQALIRVPVGDRDALARAILMMLSDPQDCDRRAKEIRRALARFSVERTGEYIIATATGAARSNERGRSNR